MEDRNVQFNCIITIVRTLASFVYSTVKKYNFATVFNIHLGTVDRKSPVILLKSSMRIYKRMAKGSIQTVGIVIPP